MPHKEGIGHTQEACKEPASNDDAREESSDLQTESNSSVIEIVRICCMIRDNFMCLAANYLLRASSKTHVIPPNTPVPFLFTDSRSRS